jgi:chromosomal replication initiator protein
VDNLLTSSESTVGNQNDIWSSITAFLFDHLTGSAYQTFQSSVSFISYSDNILTLSVPNQFSKQWVKEKCESFILSVLSSHDEGPHLIDYVISEESIVADTVQLPIFPPKTKAVPQNEAFSDLASLNPKYTFESFVVGHNNRFAHAASIAVAKAPAKAYNPLFIYGSVGLGKTHLLHAMCSRMLEGDPTLKIGLVSSEKFTNDLINSIKDKKMGQFRAYYRSLDVLVVDDIQFLSGKEQTQEEFFHTFNDLHCCNKQIILTSDRPPKEIPTLEVRLRTRFEWGLIADIQAPEFETRMAILRKKAELNNFHISDEILHYIATQVPTNVREMEGALTRVVAYASLLDTEITLSIASNVIKDMIGVSSEDRPLSITLIKERVCEYFSIADADLCSKKRTKELAYARQIAMYLARELTSASLPTIGEKFGDRDHSTVMHACDKIKTLIQNDPETQNIVTLLISNIKGVE